MRFNIDQKTSKGVVVQKRVDVSFDLDNEYVGGDCVLLWISSTLIRLTPEDAKKVGAALMFVATGLEGESS